MKRLIIEPLLSEEDAFALVSRSDAEEARSLHLPSRRSEFLTWRAIVHRELGAGVLIGYNLIGAPVVRSADVHIGVSHCRGRVAVCLSDTPCAVDIEPAERDCTHVMAHYMTPAEQALCAQRCWPLVAWCAKEVLYKFSGRIGLDLLRDLHLDAVDLARGCVTGHIENGEPLELSVSLDDNYVVVYIL